VQNLENTRFILRLCARSLSFKDLRAKSRQHWGYEWRQGWHFPSWDGRVRPTASCPVPSFPDENSGLGKWAEWGHNRRRLIVKERYRLQIMLSHSSYLSQGSGSSEKAARNTAREIPSASLGAGSSARWKARAFRMTPWTGDNFAKNGCAPAAPALAAAIAKMLHQRSFSRESRWYREPECREPQISRSLEEIARTLRQRNLG